MLQEILPPLDRQLLQKDMQILESQSFDFVLALLEDALDHRQEVLFGVLRAEDAGELMD